MNLDHLKLNGEDFVLRDTNAVHYDNEDQLEEEQKARARKAIGAAENTAYGISVRSENIGTVVYLEPNIDYDEDGLPIANNLSFLGYSDHPVRLRNIKDGVENHDAATVGQLKKAVSEFEKVQAIDEKYFDIDYDGIVSLKSEYRGLGNAGFPYSISDNGVGTDGSKISELPEKLIVPDVIDGTAVAGFQPGMLYYNYRVKELTIPESVTELPDRLCSEAFNLKAIHNTEQITKIGSGALSYTQVQKALFPNVETLATGAFAAASFLYVVDIGDKITEIPTACFTQCTLLSVVKGGSNVTKIGVQGFRYTRNLKNLPFLSLLKVTSIGDSAFYGSRIQFDWSLLSGCTIGNLAAPTKDNTVDYWSAVEHSPCENRIMSTFSQTDTESEWYGEQIGNSEHNYENGCAFFAALHIHSALSGKTYAHPSEFLNELLEIDPLYAYEGSQTVDGQNGKLPFEFSNVGPLFRDLGYTATVYTSNITEATYQELCNALARGAYVYTSVSAANVNAGHAVALYGINANKEMLVVDSLTLHYKYRAVGVDDIFTYRMAHPNLCGPSSSFVIVEKE